MTAIDNDIYTLFVMGNLKVVANILKFPRGELALPVIVVEEVLRGWLNKIRKAQTKQSDLIRAYELLSRSVRAMQQFHLLAFTDEAFAQEQQWRSEGVRVGTQDLRIAAICVSQDIKLISNNYSDFHRIPNLNLETWN